MAETEQKYSYFITTVDNPFDPCDEFDSWLLYDKMHGYDSLELLARFARTSEELSDGENQFEINQAITRIIVLDPFNIYKRIKKPVNDN